MAKGKNNKEIGCAFFISEWTVKSQSPRPARDISNSGDARKHPIQFHFTFTLEHDNIAAVTIGDLSGAQGDTR